MLRTRIGDISNADVEVLRHFASISEHILEFGMGASTQVLSYYTKGKVISLESDQYWIERTKANFDLLGIDQNKCDFILGMSPPNIPGITFDFIFVDCVDEKRLEMALASWHLLRTGGTMAFHDTRRVGDVKNFTNLINTVFSEIIDISINHWDSNISYLTKRPTELKYENWNHVENRMDWEIGYGEVDKRFFGKVGIGITTTDKREWSYKDMDAPSFDYTRYIHLDTQKHGVSFSKNNCIEMMYKEGVEYFFLFDDDVKVSDIDELINTCIRFHLRTGIHHFSLQDSRHHNVTLSAVEGLFDTYDSCSGVFLFMTRHCIDTIGYLNEAYDTYGFEHAAYSQRAYKAGLTNGFGPFITPKGISKYIYAHDFENDQLPSSLTDDEKLKFVAKNQEVYNQEVNSDQLYYGRKS